MSSVFDPRDARWEQVEVPTCQGARPAVVRTTVPARTAEVPTDALRADITAGLAQRFPQVLPIEVLPDPPGVPRGSVRLLHAAIDPDGEGVAIETLLRRNGEVTCWVAPAGRYAAERVTARRAMAGRPPLRPNATVAPRESEPVAKEVPCAPGPERVPVAEALLTVTGQGAGDWVVACHGPSAHALPTSLAEPSPGVELPASVLPMWMASVTGTGPRQVPAERPMLITSRPALDRLLALAAEPEPGDEAVRTALEAPDLPDAEAASLGALARGLVRRWSLEWIAGREDRAEASEASAPRPRGRGHAGGHVEILDAGPAFGLWRVLTGLPEVLTRDLPRVAGERAVGLVRTSPGDVWHELTLPIHR